MQKFKFELAITVINVALAAVSGNAIDVGVARDRYRISGQ
jgi:hypothetical protein